jgi:hypothetical protein
MRKLFCVALVAGCSSSGQALDGGTADVANADAAGDASSSSGKPSLALKGGFSLALGTHRPEILAAPDGNFFVAVVEPTGAPGVGQVKHRLHKYAPAGTEIGTSIVLTSVTAEYGEPADHRVALFGGKIFVVYQTLKWKGGVAPTQASGAMEDYAESQSLMLARFSLEGALELRAPIVAHVTNFQEDNFPDHCNVVVGDGLLVSTGTSRNAKLKIRKVDANGTVVETHEIPVSETTVPSSIGNSMAVSTGNVTLFGASFTNRTTTASDLDSAYQVGRFTSFGSSDVEATFPTGSLIERGHFFVGYIGRPVGGDPDLVKNPYSPYLQVIDASRNAVLNMKVGDPGFLHVHPTVAKVGDSLFVAYSKSVNGQPQSQVVEYGVTWAP